ncbi:MAG TPA: VanZ family protein, partial [Gallionellaceae bacterium]|nr:VanZ family protein [Gallionellaceae bacterium]
LLLAMALRERVGAAWNVMLSTLGGTMLSTTMEYAQMYLPVRTSSNFDVLTKSRGTLVGALLALSIASSAWFALLAHWRQSLIPPATP